MTATTVMATNHDDQLGKICPTMLNELNCTFGVSFSRFHCCGRHGHGLWPSWSWFVAVMVMVCGHHGISPECTHVNICVSIPTSYYKSVLCFPIKW